LTPELRSRFEQRAAAAPPPGLAEFGPVRPERLTVSPMGDGSFAIDVRWQGRECLLRAVVVRRLLVEAGFDARPGDSQDGRVWELRVGPVAADDVGRIIGTYIW
jgi:hypothetical protein